MRKVPESHPDVANVNFQILLMNGLEVTRRIKALMPFVHDVYLRTGLFFWAGMGQ